MRKVEEIGQVSNRKGYLRGTALWKWRNIIIGGVMLSALSIDVALMFYFRKKNQDSIEDNSLSWHDRMTKKLKGVQKERFEPKRDVRVAAELKDLERSLKRE